MSPSKNVGDSDRTITLRDRVLHGAAFGSLFNGGMALVEETATYLDGPGREESKKLGPTAKLDYSTESMRTTVRLMKCASWLLLHRAVKEGEVTLVQAADQKKKVKVTDVRAQIIGDRASLPATMQELINRSEQLEAKIQRLDSALHGTSDAELAPNAVHGQLNILKAAFGGE